MFLKKHGDKLHYISLEHYRHQTKLEIPYTYKKNPYKLQTYFTEILVISIITNGTNLSQISRKKNKYGKVVFLFMLKCLAL